ncbi:MAG: tetratricopeptide repeat protein [Candidatus Acididesulfobacter guangdongensis]|uniref:protein O-GlcNAc transferase n=1 Tax=Acididesulfobacter guangdongensis TaxID=2597225 RepID=A0A519BFE1_ACIG2|nr:MAG: tetratricopeptide repeat protein [Candidatus Acididesulfobacter guangdongensis]
MMKNYRAAAVEYFDNKNKYKEAVVALFDSGNYAEAQIVARNMTEKFPDCAFAWKALGAILKMLGKTLESIGAMQQAIELDPADAIIYSNLSATLQDINRYREAQMYCLKAIELQPDLAIAYHNLGSVLNNLGRPLDAQAVCLRAIQLKPDFAEAYYNLGNSFNEIGAQPEAQLSYLRAIELMPDSLQAYDNILMGMNYNPDFSISYYKEWAEKYGTLISSRVNRKFTNHNMPKSGDKLKVGFVSGDFRNHAVGLLLENMLGSIKNIELYAYSAHNAEDELTWRIKPYFKKWTAIYDKNDEESAHIIYKDGINILLDLSGHTRFNRLPVFAYKPAPVQASWLGYPASTGVKEIDYFIGDYYTSPKSEESHFNEKIYRFQNSCICLAPPCEAPKVGMLPALRNRFITFGCFNNLAKINDEVIAIWSEILLQIPAARLFLKTKQLGNKNVQDILFKKFNDNGVAEPAKRLILEGASPRAELLASYNKIDIALDPFPYNGGVTGAESVYMGVPILTLKGDRFVSRVGESIANNVGLSKFIAQNKEEYIKKAKDNSLDIAELADLRANLRNISLRSSLFDGARFAKDFENAMADIWMKSF